ncbi:MAG: Response regulator of zinc sigma-54-dependent two-component system [Myxococcaceae bacterium]|nr:Response regulator of zinc sigma-54-dependent two-component system [Myxococcaceae bacterium]
MTRRLAPPTSKSRIDSEMTSASDKAQRAAITLADGSHIELVITPSATRAAVDLARVLELVRSELTAPERPKELGASYRGLVGRSPAMQALFRMCEKVAPTQATVLITGENGTGKELVARAIHDGSTRAKGPFVAANCSAFNDNLLESELFGHRRGAFTGASFDKRGLFEEADTGTFLLDEVGDMTPALQVKLLRVLQEGTFLPVGGTQTKKVDVLIIAATNRDLIAMVKQGRFREDLYYRLHVVAMRTPPLRERGEDLTRLIEHFLQRLGERHGRSKALDPVTFEKLKAHRWPGNVRELQNEMERIWVLSGDERVIGPEHLSRTLSAVMPRENVIELTAPEQEAGSAGAAVGVEVPDEPLQQTLERVERQIIERALAKVNGNRTRAATALGVSRRNLIRKLQQLGLSGGDDADAGEG